MAAPKKKTGMVKSGRGHSYTLDGRKVPGVTTILGNGVPKAGLIGWASGTVADFVVNRLAVAKNEKGEVRIVADELVADALAWNATRSRPANVSGADHLPRSALLDILKNIRYRDLDEAGSRGTEVHHYAQKLNRGETVVVPPELVGHVRAYVRFLSEWRPANALVERSGGNRAYRYMGTFDLLADFPGVWANGPWRGRRIGRGLVDVKTARSGVFAENALQLVGYKHLEFYLDEDGNEVPMPEVDWVGVIHVRTDGYTVTAFDIDDSTFNTFLYVKAVGEWLAYPDGTGQRIMTPTLNPPIIDDGTTDPKETT